MTSDGAVLFRAVCDNAADDTPRLAYADWLEENGNRERAEFIRLQCDAWRTDPADPTPAAARTRASALLKLHGETWHAELPDVPGVTWSDLFVRGFVDAAWVEAKKDVRAQLEGRIQRDAAATPHGDRPRQKEPRDPARDGLRPPAGHAVAAG